MNYKNGSGSGDKTFATYHTPNLKMVLLRAVISRGIFITSSLTRNGPFRRALENPPITKDTGGGQNMQSRYQSEGGGQVG